MDDKITMNCVECGGKFETPAMNLKGKLVALVHRCQSCGSRAQARQEAEELQRRQAELRASWKEICPPAYWETIESLLPQDVLESCLQHQFLNGQGLLLLGPSRVGKTRLAWAALRRQHMLGQRIIATSEAAFSVQADTASHNRTLDAFLNRLIHCEIFFIDDIGHAATTDRHAERLYYVIEQRTSHKRPIIATTQFSGDEWSAQANGREKTIAAIVGRLREFCLVVQLSGNEQPQTLCGVR